MSNLRLIPLFAACIALSGCFTAMNEMGNSWSGGNDGRMTAAALDVATSPIQVPVLFAYAIGAGASAVLPEQERVKPDIKTLPRYKSLLRDLQKNPEIALRKRWDNRGVYHLAVLHYSFLDNTVTYSEELIHDMFREMPAIHESMFASDSCSSRFYVENFDYLLDNARQGRTRPIELAIRSENIPDFLLKRISYNPELDAWVRNMAKKKLDERHNSVDGNISKTKKEGAEPGDAENGGQPVGDERSP